MITQEDIINRFTYHPPSPDQVPKYNELRATGGELAERIVELVPAGREQSLAITHLEQAIMWANAGIARAPSSGS